MSVITSYSNHFTEGICIYFQKSKRQKVNYFLYSAIKRRHVNSHWTKKSADLLCAPAPLSVCGPQTGPPLWLQPVSLAGTVLLVLAVACVDPALWRAAHTVPPSAGKQTYTGTFPEATSHSVTRKHVFWETVKAWLTLALYRFASSAISTACLTWRQADHSLCCASCWLARAARRARSNSSRSLKDWQTRKCRINIKQKAVPSSLWFWMLTFFCFNLPINYIGKTNSWNNTSVVSLTVVWALCWLHLLCEPVNSLKMQICVSPSQYSLMLRTL